MMLGSALIFASCGGDSEASDDEKKEETNDSKKESVVDYADQFCECMKEKSKEECKSIIEEAQEKFPDGRKEFENRMKDCDIEM